MIRTNQRVERVAKSALLTRALIHMNYRKLSREDFDAIVTGELTHYALWLEDELIGIISDYFLGTSEKRRDFTRLLLRRDGLTFQNKIDIVRAMLPLFTNSEASSDLKKILTKIENFKVFRNALAHGLDIQSSTADKMSLRIEVVTRSGKEKTVEITPASHQRIMNNTENLLEQLQKVRKALKR